MELKSAIFRLLWILLDDFKPIHFDALLLSRDVALQLLHGYTVSISDHLIHKVLFEGRESLSLLGPPRDRCRILILSAENFAEVCCNLQMEVHDRAVIVKFVASGHLVLIQYCSD